MKSISAHLDSLDATTRLAEVVELTKTDQARLFEAAKGHRAITLADVVPADRPAMAEVVHQGKNTLPAFTRFAKVFCKPQGNGNGPKELWGYNRNAGFIESTVGPGYFVARLADDPSEVLIDYLKLPPDKPTEWPKIRDNKSGLGRFVYHGMQDVLRGVSKHVSIGRASKGGKDMNAWFVLCRQE